MSKKPVDRRPDEKPTGPGAGSYTPGKPQAGRMPEDLQERKGKDFFEGERSDRESGRPVQLENKEASGRSDGDSGRPVELEADEGRFEQRKGRQDRSVREAEPTQR